MSTSFRLPVFLSLCLALAFFNAGVSEAQISVSPPEFSVKAGFYTQPVVVEIHSSDPQVEIYFTLDGSTPTTSSARYESALTIANRTGDPNTISMIPTNNQGPGGPYREHWRAPQGPVHKGTVLRAIAVSTGGDISEVTTASYFMNISGKERYANMPVISIATDPANFFDDEIGIYVHGNFTNFDQRGAEWERPIHFEMIEADGSLVLSQNAGARVHGGTSRGRPLKTLRLYARSEYGETWFNHDIFPDKPVGRYKRLLLRNSGNDWSESLLRDLFMQSLIKEPTELDMQYGRPAIVFINGEYWGIQNIRERFDERYLQSHYGIGTEEATFLEPVGTNYISFARGTTDGMGHFETLYSNLSLDANIMNGSRFDELSEMMDMQNFTDYNIAQIYFRNTDWPSNNKLYWRYNLSDVDSSRGGPMPRTQNMKDGRWRWMLFDTDFGFGLNFDYVEGSGNNFGWRNHGGNNAQHNTVAFALESENRDNWPNPRSSTYLLRSLLVNNDFRANFANRFADLLNSSFHPDYVTAHLDSISAIYRPFMDEHTRRWNEPASLSVWENEITRIRSFGQQREQAIRNHLNNELNLGGLRAVTLDVSDQSAGVIQINSIRIDRNLPGTDEISAYPWTGQYFRNAPVTLTAHANPGYRFVEWQGDLSGSQNPISATLTASQSIIAIFEAAPGEVSDPMSPAAWPLSEENYRFDSWSQTEPTGSFPESMVFLQSNMNDPELADEMTSLYDPGSDLNVEDADFEGFPYRLTRRTRINALGNRGISFINTGRGRDLGTAVLALDLRGIDEAEVSWTGGTELANSRVYAIRLQYRDGGVGNWSDLLDNNGDVVEYERTSQDGHELEMGPTTLPETLMGRPYVQLRWKYYFTGEQLSNESGQRDELRLDNIYVRQVRGVSTPSDDRQGYLPGRTELHPNVPNPFNPTTDILFSIPERQVVRVEVYDVIGRSVAEVTNQIFEAGQHRVRFDAGGLSSGVYLVMLKTQFENASQKITLIK